MKILGLIIPQSRLRSLDAAITVAAKRAGADSVILGWTAVCKLLNNKNAALPNFDPTGIHANALADFALAA